MANNVFANGREIACKAGAGKTICAFPDVCFTPPDKVPATPLGIPIPYPNTGKASDTTGGSKKVNISKKEIGLKNKSCFKKSMGDEAGAAAKKGVVTSKNKGKVYFSAWSMDVKIEGENVVRHLDLTTNNHASQPGDTPPWPEVERVAPSSKAKVKPCEKKCKEKKLSKSEQGKLRKTKEYNNAKTKVNDRKKPIACPACKSKVNYVSPDHIVPVAIVTQMPGFSCLPKDDQSKIVNHPSNFVGLCPSCNSSKRDKLWARWKEHKVKGITFSPKLRSKAQKLTGNIIFNLKNMIREKECV